MEQTENYIDEDGNTVVFSDNSLKIRELNDRARKFAGLGGVFGNYKTVLTNGVTNLIEADKLEMNRLIKVITNYNNFSYGNDPWGEHDFGNFTINGENMYFKIDYYSLDLKAGSPDPTDETQTCRVLTIMLTSEY